jgi:DNA (cytosine-5)-methyltransferase 1
LGAHIACRQLKRRLRIELAADSWPDALEVYKDNFKGAVGAITTDDLGGMLKHAGSMTLSKRGRELVATLAPIDVVLAGPPCQGHSDLNNSSRRDDPRNFLYAVPVALGIKTKAKVLLIENVPPVIHAAGGVVKSAEKALVENGYAVAEFLADAQDFGVPQTRRRHILVASRLHSQQALLALLARLKRRTNDISMWPFISDLEFEGENPQDLSTKRSVISSDNLTRIDYLFDNDVVDLPNRLRPTCHRDKPHSYVSMYGRLSASLPAQTITSGFGSMGQGRFVHPTQRRMLTPHEAARIQGFPDYFRFTKAKKLTALREMIGNAVAPPIAAVLLTLLLSP